MSGLQKAVIRMSGAFFKHGLSSHSMALVTVSVLALFLQQLVLSAALSQSVGASTLVKLPGSSMLVSNLVLGAVRKFLRIVGLVNDSCYQIAEMPSPMVHRAPLVATCPALEMFLSYVVALIASMSTVVQVLPILLVVAKVRAKERVREAERESLRPLKTSQDGLTLAATRMHMPFDRRPHT